MAATINAADLLDLTNEIGSLEAGKSADLIALPRDPFDDLGVLKHVRAVIRAGQQL